MGFSSNILFLLVGKIPRVHRALRYNYADVGFLGLKAEMEPFDLDTH